MPDADLYPVYGDPRVPENQWALGLQSAEAAADDIQIDYSIGGLGRARVFYVAKKRSWTAAHPWLTLQDRMALDAFYDSHRGVVIKFPIDTIGSTADALMIEPPQCRMIRNGIYSATQRLVEFP